MIFCLMKEAIMDFSKNYQKKFKILSFLYLINSLLIKRQEWITSLLKMLTSDMVKLNFDTGSGKRIIR